MSEIIQRLMNVAAAEEAMRVRYDRFEALSCYLSEGVEQSLVKHGREERSIGASPASPDEISKALAETVVRFLRHDDAIEGFIEDLRLSASWPDERTETL